LLLKYELLGLAVLYVAWTIFKAVMDWTDRRKEFDILLDECRAEWRRRHPPPFPGLWDFVYQRLSTVRVMLYCGSASIFERDERRCKIRNMFLGPINFEACVPKCVHGAEAITRS